MDNVRQPLPTNHKERILRPATHRIQKALRSRRKQKGFDLIQLGLVVALIGLMMGAALVGVPKLIENIKTGQQVDDLRSFTSQAQAFFAPYRNDEITQAALIAAQLYPTQKMGEVTAATYLSRFGDTVTITLAEGATDTSRQLQIAFTAPSSTACSKIAGQLSRSVDSMQVGGASAVVADNNRVSPALVTASCAEVGATTTPIPFTLKVKV